MGGTTAPLTQHSSAPTAQPHTPGPHHSFQAPVQPSTPQSDTPACHIRDTQHPSTHTTQHPAAQHPPCWDQPILGAGGRPGAHLHHPHVQPRLGGELLPHVPGGLGGVLVGVLQRLQLLGRDGGPGPLRPRLGVIWEQTSSVSIPETCLEEQPLPKAKPTRSGTRKSSKLRLEAGTRCSEGHAYRSAWPSRSPPCTPASRPPSGRTRRPWPAAGCR